MQDKSAMRSLRPAPFVVGTIPQVKSGELTPAQEAVVISHLPIVRAIARRIHERLPRHVAFEDLCSAGTIGLLDAVTRFDPRKDVLFRSFAQFRIRGAILDSLRSLDWGTRSLRRKGREIVQTVETLGAQLGRTPTASEVAAALNITLPAYQLLLVELSNLESASFRQERVDASDGNSVDLLPARPQDDPLCRFLRDETRGRITDAITRLPERDRLVMTLYYYEELSMKEIGLILGVMECSVSRIHASCVTHLRNELLGLENVNALSAGIKHAQSHVGKEKTSKTLRRT